MSIINSKIWMLISIFVLFLTLMPGINHGLWGPDEPRVAGICVEMVRTGNFIVPHLNGKPFLEEPPLYYAVGALFASIFSADSDVSYRLASILFSALTLILVFHMASREKGISESLIATGILASSWLFFRVSRLITVDISLVFGVALAMYAYLAWLKNNRVRDSLLLGFALSISFFAKGLIGPAIIAIAILTDIIRQRDVKIVWRLRPFTVISIMLLPILLWLTCLYYQGGWPFVREVIVVNNIMRFTGAPDGAALGHQEGLFDYFISFPKNFLPWTFLFIPACIFSLRNFRDNVYISWFIGPFILLSLASTKRGIYLAPLFPAASCLVAMWIMQEKKMRWEMIMIKITWVIAVLCCFLPFGGGFINRPFLGIGLGCLSLGGSFSVLQYLPERKYAGLSLVLVMCIALSTSTPLYFSFMKHREDYLYFAKDAVTAAGNRDITIIGGNERIRGVMSLAAHRTLKEISDPSGIMTKGFYVWGDRSNTVLNLLKDTAAVNVITVKDIEGSKQMVLAYIVPHISPEFPDRGGH